MSQNSIFVKSYDIRDYFSKKLPDPTRILEAECQVRRGEFNWNDVKNLMKQEKNPEKYSEEYWMQKSMENLSLGNNKPSLMRLHARIKVPKLIQNRPLEDASNLAKSKAMQEIHDQGNSYPGERKKNIIKQFVS